jgi:hypothetical protein
MSEDDPFVKWCNEVETIMESKLGNFGLIEITSETMDAPCMFKGNLSPEDAANVFIGYLKEALCQ